MRTVFNENNTDIVEIHIYITTNRTAISCEERYCGNNSHERLALSDYYGEI